jgi:transglutaminase-like putative cysteine protease
VVFVLLAVLGATTLSAVATAPPQRIEDGLLEGPLDELREALGGWLALFAIDPSPPGVTLDDRLEVADEWQQGDGVAFVAEVAEPGLRGNYWWLSAWADFDGRSWSREATTTEEVPALTPIEVPADASGAGPTDIRVSITPRRSRLALGTLLAPSEAVTVDRSVRVRSLGDREGLTEITLAEELLRGASYRVTSAAWDYAAPDGTLTASRLRAAGTDYPAWMERYLRIEAGASGPRTVRLAREVEAEARGMGLEDPFDLARILQDRLRTLEYRTSVEGLCEADENVPECLLRTGTGFCQHFASTMVMALREMDVPARLVSGYLPGLSGADGRYEVPLQALHAWVEVYFPGTGWIRFDPTPGEQLRAFEQQATDLPEGQPPGSPGPSASTAPPDAAASLEPSPPAASPSPMAVVPSSLPPLEGMASGLLLAGGLAILILVCGAVLLLIRLRRLPQADGALAWGRIAGLATRLGHGPHPAQTEYEYAASLAEALPSVRDDLYVVADARVAQRYGRHALPGERRGALRRAYARVRTALLRLGWGDRGR